MKIVFFGLGSIGVRHAQYLQKLYNHDLYAFRSKKDKSNSRRGVKNIFSWSEIDMIQPQVAMITNPTSLHIETAIRCAQRGMHLFIEKPLGSRLGRLNELLRLVKQRKISTYVAYVLRFHPVIKALKRYLQKDDFLHMRVIASSYLPSWHPTRDHLKRYAAQKKMGGGVIYDLSHELDYTQYLLGDIRKMSGQFARRSDVTVDAEDYADLLLETKKGPANIHINFMSHLKQRMIQIDFKNKYVQGDLLANTVSEYRKGKRVKLIKYKGTLQNCFEDQLRYFFKNIRNPRMMNNVSEAAGLVKKIQAFKGRSR